MFLWSRIKEWFSQSKDRSVMLNDFNSTAKMAFVTGNAPTLLQASVSKGESAYRHSFSRWLASGFRIKVMSGCNLTKKDIITIGTIILTDNMLIRTMVVNGFDTLEIYGDKGTSGAKWQLKDFILIGN